MVVYDALSSERRGRRYAARAGSTGSARTPCAQAIARSRDRADWPGTARVAREIAAKTDRRLTADGAAAARSALSPGRIERLRRRAIGDAINAGLASWSMIEAIGGRAAPMVVARMCQPHENRHGRRGAEHPAAL
jgi:hypothetical protein